MTSSEPPSHDSQSRRVAWAIFLVAMSMLAFELVLTRLFSVILWNHFAFLAISIGLFGFGVAGVTAFVLPQTFSAANAPRQLRALCFALPPVMWVVVAIVCALPIRMDFSNQMFLYLMLIFSLTSVPFMIGGMAITLALTHWPRQVNRIYAFDLVGSAIGCGLVIALLGVFDGPTVGIALGVLPAIALMVLRPSWVGTGLLALVVVFVGLNESEGWARVRIARSKVQQPIFEKWNAFSRVTVASASGFQGWWVSPHSTAPKVNTLGIVIDGDAFTPMVHFDGDLDRVAILLDDLTALAFRLKTDAKQALVIGPGGGKDVLAALAAGVERVRAVELNPIIAHDIVSGEFRSFSGDLYRHPRVELEVGEGRTVVRHDEGRYDVLQISMVDTSAASAAGAYSLAENSLYTVSAAREFLQHLEPGGIVTTTWANFSNLEGVNRLVAVYDEALTQEGAETGHDKIAVIAGASAHKGLGTPLATVLIKPSGFSDAESARLRDLVETGGFVPVYIPGDPLVGGTRADARVVRRLLSRRNLDEFFDEYRLDLTPVDDDRPFFFYQNRMRDLGTAFTTWNPGPLFGNGMFILVKLLLVSILAVVGFMVLPLVFRRRQELRDLAQNKAWLTYFCCLGTGFIVAGDRPDPDVRVLPRPSASRARCRAGRRCCSLPEWAVRSADGSQTKRWWRP